MKTYSFVITILVSAFFLSGPVQAQDTLQKTSSLKAIRLGVKAGMPNVIGGHIEYVTPLLNERLAPSIEYSTIGLHKLLDVNRADVTYFEAGLNYYFQKGTGKGIYVHLGYGSFKGDYEEDGYTIDGTNREGTATYGIDHGSFNIRLGKRMGGLLYFRSEVGYMFSPFPDSVDIEVAYPDGTTEIDRVDLPKILTSGIMFNLGIGFAF